MEKNISKEQAESAVRTAMIGALFSIEECFGYLWGHGKQYEELTQYEKEMDALYEKLRKDILDKGNLQIRKMNSQKKEVYHFKVRKNNGN